MAKRPRDEPADGNLASARTDEEGNTKFGPDADQAAKKKARKRKLSKLAAKRGGVRGGKAGGSVSALREARKQSRVNKNKDDDDKFERGKIPTRVSAPN